MVHASFMLQITVQLHSYSTDKGQTSLHQKQVCVGGGGVLTQPLQGPAGQVHGFATADVFLCGAPVLDGGCIETTIHCMHVGRMQLPMVDASCPINPLVHTPSRQCYIISLLGVHSLIRCDSTHYTSRGVNSPVHQHLQDVLWCCRPPVAAVAVRWGDGLFWREVWNLSRKTRRRTRHTAAITQPSHSPGGGWFGRMHSALGLVSNQFYVAADGGELRCMCLHEQPLFLTHFS